MNPIINKHIRKHISELPKYQQLIYDNCMSGYAYSEGDGSDDIKRVVFIIDDAEISFFRDTDIDFQKENGHKFSSVSRSFNAFAKENTIEEVTWFAPVVYKLSRLDFEAMPKKDYIATDLDHAYWRIAYLLGYISERLYTGGLRWDKKIRNMTMAVLATERKFLKFDNGEFVPNESIIIKRNTIARMYKNIRHTCYQHMNALMVMLGDGFLCYKTDCIYYKKDNNNLELVRNYLIANGLLFKDLIEVDGKKKGLNRADE